MVDHQYVAIQSFLKVEVPREIQAVLNRGGINDRDWAWLRQECNDDPDDFRPINVLMRADSYLLYPSNTEVFQTSLLVLRKAIALLSFVEGGIRFFGMHFSIEIEGFVEQEEWCYSPAEWEVMESA